MSIIESFFGVIATWFGYVGSCVASPDASCWPFLAFVVLAAASAAALALVVLAYQALKRDESHEVEEQRAKARALAAHERIRRTILARETTAATPLALDRT
ncbi:MAG TPA: hypothetical protein VM164_13915 [Burkholderiales bacterium]|nr:hypothetical protein [Burkholderiales bacterium]